MGPGRDPPVILFELKDGIAGACPCAHRTSRPLKKKEIKEALRVRVLYGYD